MSEQTYIEQIISVEKCVETLNQIMNEEGIKVVFNKYYGLELKFDDTWNLYGFPKPNSIGIKILVDVGYSSTQSLNVANEFFKQFERTMKIMNEIKKVFPELVD